MSLFYYLLNYSDVNFTRKVINIMIVKDFSDELIALYENAEDAEDTEEVTIAETEGATTAKEGAKNSIVTVLAAPDLNTAYQLLLNKAKSNPVVDKIAKKISIQNGRYSILFTDLEEVYGMSIDNTPGLLEFWTIVKLMVESKSGWSGKGMTNSWTDRLVNAFYKPALTEAGILEALKNNFPKYGFEFNSSDLDEHKYFFSGPGNSASDFISKELEKKEYSGLSSKPGTVECKPENTTSNIYNAVYILRYSSIYAKDAEGSGKFWFELNPKLKTAKIPPDLPTVNKADFNIKPVKLDSKQLDDIYKTLCEITANQLQQNIKQDYGKLKADVIDKLNDVNKLEKKSFVDANHSLKDAPLELQAATKQLNTLINRKAEIATLLPKSAKVQTEGFMKTYEELNTLN